MSSNDTVGARVGNGPKGPKNQGQNDPTKEEVMENITQESAQIVSQPEVTTNSPKTAERATKLKNFKLESQIGANGRMLDLAQLDKRSAKLPLSPVDALRGDTEVKITAVQRAVIDDLIPRIENTAKLFSDAKVRTLVDIKAVIASNKSAAPKPLTHLNGKGQQDGENTVDFWFNTNFEWDIPSLLAMTVETAYEVVGRKQGFRVFNGAKDFSGNAHAVATNIKTTIDATNHKFRFMSEFEIAELADPTNAISLEDWLAEREDVKALLVECIANMQSLRQTINATERTTPDPKPKMKAILISEGLEVGKITIESTDDSFPLQVLADLLQIGGIEIKQAS